MLFKKAAVFTDIHLGKKSDSLLHNQDCLRFIEWFCKQVTDNNCDCVIFMGDFFENQSKIGTVSLHYTHLVVQRLSDLGVPIYWIVGNHDLFHKYSRDLVSISFVQSYPNIVYINEITEIDNVLLCPWLIAGEYSIPPTHKVKYIFGHFELPLFLVNDLREMHDRGGLHADHFYQCEAVFSGHFHKRQIQTNKEGIPIYYIGNTFPMDFNDAGDRDRGCMILEWDGTPEFINWDEAPNYSNVKLSELVNLIDGDGLETRFNQFSIIDCKDDLNTELQEIVEIRNALSDMVREIQIRQQPSIAVDISQASTVTDDKQDLDTMVVSHISEMEVKDDEVEPDLLIKIYNGEKRDGSV